MAVCSEIHTKHINTLCGQNMEYLGTSENYEKQLLASSVCLSDSTEQLGSTGRIVMKFGICEFFDNPSRTVTFH